MKDYFTDLYLFKKSLVRPLPTILLDHPNRLGNLRDRRRRSIVLAKHKLRVYIFLNKRRYLLQTRLELSRLKLSLKQRDACVGVWCGAVEMRRAVCTRACQGPAKIPRLGSQCCPGRGAAGVLNRWGLAAFVTIAEHNILSVRTYLPRGCDGNGNFQSSA